MTRVDKSELESLTSRKDWWREHKVKHTKGLVISGITSFICFAIIICFFIVPFAGFIATLTTIFFLSIIYFIAMFIFNLLYKLGHLADYLFNKSNNEKIRIILFNLIYWFSVALPFLIPVIPIVIYFIDNRR